MKKFLSHITSRILIFLLSLSLVYVSCSNSSLTGNAETSSAGSTDFSDDSGPIDLPVTIAKLESVDALNIAVTADSDGASLTKDLQVIGGDTLTFTGNGDADNESERAVHAPSTTPFILVHNHNTDDSVIVPVATNGSFEATIAATTQEPVGIYAITTDDVTTAESSAGVYFTLDSLGTITITFSNHDAINDEMPLSVSADGSIYFSAISDDGTYDLWRRNMDGTVPNRVLTGAATAPLYTVATSVVGAEEQQNVLLLDSVVDILLRTSLDESSEGDADLWTTLIENISTMPAGEVNLESNRYFISYLNEETFLLKRPSDDGSTEVLEAITADGARTMIIDGSQGLGPTQIENLRFAFAMGPQKTIVIFQNTGTGLNEIHLLALTNADGSVNYDGAWSREVTILQTGVFEVNAIIGINDAEFAAIVEYNDGKKLITLNTNSEMSILSELTADGITPMNLLAYYNADNAAGIVLCDDTNSEKRLLYYSHDASLDAGHQPTVEAESILTNQRLRSCNHFQISTVDTEYNILHFFTAEEDGSSSQLSAIILENVL